MLQIGDLKIHLINDGNTLSDPGGPFGLVPRALWARVMPPVEDYYVVMSTVCLLIQTGDMNILVDNGRGRKLSEKSIQIMKLSRPHGDVLDAIARLGLSPADINLVINTHLHADHCGGNTILDEHGKLVAAFPNAEYVVQRREYEDACKPNERTAATYLAENWEPLIENGQMRLLDGDTQLAPGITGIVAPGHTPGHMIVKIESGGEYAAFLCDLSTFAVHFERLGWMTAYDVEPLVTLETKRTWQQWALEHNAVMIFPHDPERPCGTFSLGDKGKGQITPLDEAFV